jgi:hypothetical protein
VRWTKRHGMVHGSLLLFLLKLKLGGVVKMLLVSVAVPESHLWLLEAAVIVPRRGCVQRDKSCIPSSSECSSRTGLEGHLGQEDIGFSFVGSVLEQSVSSLEENSASVAYRMRPRSCGTPAYCAACCSLATARQSFRVRGCAYEVWKKTAEVRKGPCS